MGEAEGALDVRVSRLEKAYGEVKALAGVTFSVRRGEIFGYLGPNGAGKTTTINILCGLVDRDGGEVAVSGLDVRTDPVGVKERIGVVPEESNLYPELTCRANLEYLGELYGLPRRLRRERAGELLEMFDLAGKADAPFRTLSRGMKRRLTVGAALVHSPAILFLDEPTAGLDVPGARALRRLITSVKGEGTTVFLTTHNLLEAEQLCDRVLILVGGRVTAEGTAREIRRRVERARTLAVAFSGEVASEVLCAACPAVRSAQAGDDVWKLEVADAHEAIVQIVAFARSRDLRITELSTAVASLEEAFIRILGDDERKRGDGR